jgi:hypothetical protein
MNIAKNVAGVAFVITLLAGVSASAMNFNHVSKCQIVQAGGTWTSAGQFDNTSLGTAELWCPVDYTLGSAPTSVTASVWSNGCQSISGTFVVGQSARVCVAHAGGGAATCGSFKEPATCNAGINQLNALVPGSFNPNSGDYLYLDVFMEPRNPNNNSDDTFFGYTVLP